jgi:hypothetical protein
MVVLFNVVLFSVVLFRRVAFRELSWAETARTAVISSRRTPAKYINCLLI